MTGPSLLLDLQAMKLRAHRAGVLTSWPDQGLPPQLQTTADELRVVCKAVFVANKQHMMTPALLLLLCCCRADSSKVQIRLRCFPLHACAPLLHWLLVHVRPARTRVACSFAPAGAQEKTPLQRCFVTCSF